MGIAIAEITTYAADAVLATRNTFMNTIAGPRCRQLARPGETPVAVERTAGDDSGHTSPAHACMMGVMATGAPRPGDPRGRPADAGGPQYPRFVAWLRGEAPRANQDER